MTGKDFFTNELILKMIEELKAGGIKMEGEFTEDDATYTMDRRIKLFKMATGEEATYLLDVLKKDYGDLYKFVFVAANDGAPRPYVMVPDRLVSFAMIKYFPNQFEKYLSLFQKTFKKAAKILRAQYDEAIGK